MLPSLHARALCCLLTLATILVAAGGFSSSSQATSLMVEDFGAPGSTIRSPALATTDHLGARYARLIVTHGTWGSSFDWTATVDAFVSDSAAHEMKPYLTLSGPATPTTSDYGRWCGEAAARYDGRAHPLVLDYGVWNEPNHNGIAATAYRGLYRACRSAIKAVLPSANVYYGEIEAGSDSACTYLDNSLPPTPGGSDPTLVTDGLAIHPYQYTTDPTRPVAGSTCGGIGNLPTWSSRLATAAGARRLQSPSGGTAALLVSEFGYCTDRTPGTYLPTAAQAACPQNADGVGNKLDDTTRAAWTASAYTWAQSRGVTIFDYHGIAKRPAGDWNGNPGGYLWESGLIENPSGTYTPSVNALRSAAGTQSPDATTTAATGVQSRQATLNGSVNPHGFLTSYHFEYGPTTSYGTSVPYPNDFVGAGGSPVAVSRTITGLFPSATYHYRLVATSRTGTTLGVDQTFRTASAVHSLNGDSKADLILADPATNTFAVATSTGSVLGGLSTGTWLIGWDSSPDWARTGDFNGDDKTDVIMADPIAGTYTVALSGGSHLGARGSGTWLTGWGGRPEWAEVGDFNGDGKDDLIGTDSANGLIRVALSDGTTLRAAGSGNWMTAWGGARPRWADVGDFNGDGKDDFIVADPINNVFAVALSDGRQLTGSGNWITGWNSNPQWAAAG